MIKFNVGKMLHILKIVSAAAGKVSTLPILENVFISYGPTSYVLVTDTDVQLAAKIEISCDGEGGSLLLPLKKFQDICSSHDKSSEGCIKIGDSKALFRIGRGKYTFNILNTRDFPIFMSSNDEESLVQRLPSSFLLECINTVSHAQPVNDVRFYLNGIHIESKDGLTAIVATDGHRLAYYEADTDFIDANFTVQRKGVDIIKKLLDEEEEVNINFGSKSIEVVGKNVTAKSKLIDGKYPLFRPMIEKKSELKVLVNRLSFIQALRRVSIVIDSRDGGVKLSIDNDNIVISTRNSAAEMADERVECTMSEKMQLELGFNPGYLIDSASAVRTENIEIWLTPGSDSGAVIKGEGRDSYVSVVMQMRL